MAQPTQPSDNTIQYMLKNYALMRSINETQGPVAVDLARSAGWTYERIMEATGLGYTAVRGLDPRLQDAA